MPEYSEMTAYARVVYERSHSYHDSAGPCEMGKIGVAIGDRVFWTAGFCFPGDSAWEYGRKIAFATELASRWNAGRALQEHVGKEAVNG